MNCRRVQKLIPLYVEDDVEPRVANRITAHLEWCGQCNWLADEYRESQSWLRDLVPPEFNNAQLDVMKSSVLTEIAAIRQRPSMLALLAQHWNRRQVIALSAVALMIFGMVVLYVYQARVKSSASHEVARETPNEEDPLLGEAGSGTGAKTAPGALSQAPFPQSKDRRRVVVRSPKVIVARETEPHVSSEVATQSPETIMRGTSTSSKEALRIEIQTSDPLIRIIWFAPKETDLHQPKSATD